MYRESTLAGPPSCPGFGDHFYYVVKKVFQLGVLASLIAGPANAIDESQYKLGGQTGESSQNQTPVALNDSPRSETDQGLEKLLPEKILFESTAEENETQKYNNRAYIILGSSSESKYPLHFGLGVTHYFNLTDTYSLGIDINSLSDNPFSESNVGLLLQKRINKYSAAIGIGISRVESVNYTHNFQKTTRFRVELGRQISDKTKLSLTCAQNSRNSSLSKEDYPQQRFAISLETAF